jgi:hypothetical protein
MTDAEIIGPKTGQAERLFVEWMSLPRQNRQTEEQAAAFATKATEKHEFTCGSDRHRRIMTWAPHRQVVVHRFWIVPHIALAGTLTA